MILGGAPLVGHLAYLRQFSVQFRISLVSLLVCGVIPFIDRDEPHLRA